MRIRDRWIILVAFVISVLVRIPGLDRPLSAHHEYCTALVMTVLHNWHVDGFMAHHGAPAITFTGPADRYPEGWVDGPAEMDGVLYYFSHPPLAYDLPFLLFKLLHMAPNVLGLQLFNILFHLIAAVCLLMALREAWPDKDPGDAPLFASMLYLFMPAPLWFHANAYMSDMFVQNFWMMHLAVAMRVFMRKAPTAFGTELLFGATLFLTVLTSWLGVFAGVVSAAIAFRQGWKHGRVGAYRLVGISCIAVVGALLFTAWRYTWNMEIASLLDYLRSRLAVRGSIDMEKDVVYYLRQLVENYRTGYLPVIALCGALVAFLLMKGHKRIGMPQGAGLFLALTGIPVLLDHLFLLQYSHHDFAVLKAGPLLCGVAGILLLALRSRQAWMATALTCLAGMLYFLRLNPVPGKDGGRYTFEKDLGTGIKAVAAPDQAVLFMGYTPEPQVAWYAGRTIFRIDSIEQGRELIQAQGTQSAVVLSLEDGVLHHSYIEASP